MQSLSFEKRECLKRARELLARGDDAALRYASLELRFCIEAITYEKLRTYAPRLPACVVETWQPPQAMKALVQIEPDAARSFILRMGNEPVGGRADMKTLGTHYALDLDWLRKAYNKLGNYLHVPSPKKAETRPQGPDAAKVRKDLDQVASALEPAANNTFDCSFANVIDFRCVQCQQLIVANADGLRRTNQCQCLNQACGAMYWAAEETDGSFKFILQATEFKCGECGRSVTIESRKLGIGFEFSCGACGAKHRIANRQWQAEVEVTGTDAARP